MHTYNIILKKRNGEELTTQEINSLIHGLTAGQIPDYQIAAWLMAVYFKGMTEREVKDLTLAMANSGKILDLSSIPGIKLDKHSTGGVGDKTTLVLCPLVAATGCKVAKLSGRGLGHTGGTIDKLEAIPGFNANLTISQFIDQVKQIGIAIASSTEDLAPADKKLYALRDVTATVDCIPLIASSVMSKKIAGGADGILLDIKVGSGAFMKSPEAAKRLASMMTGIGKGLGKPIKAVLTNMNQPLGYAVGNALEVEESIQTLKGNGPPDLTELCLELGSHMLILGQKASSVGEARKILAQTLKSGKALAKFQQLIEAQGGNPEVIANPKLLPQARIRQEITAPQKGYIQKINAEAIGQAAMLLGAGRLTKDATIDHAAGLILHKKVGDEIKLGEPIFTVYANDSQKAELALPKLMAATQVSPKQPKQKPLIYGILG